MTFVKKYMKKKFEYINNILVSYPKEQLVKITLFLFVFSIVKIISFTTPVLLSNFAVSRDDYGYFEYLIATGSILSIILNSGFNGAYPYFTLRLKLNAYKTNFYFHLFWGLALVTLSAILYIFNITSEKIVISLLIGCIISIQGLLSSIFKSHGKIISAVLLDTGIYILLMFYVLYLSIVQKYFSLTLLKTILIGYACILATIITILFLYRKKDFNWIKYNKIFKYAFPLVLSSFLIIILTGSTRVFIEYFPFILESPLLL